MSGDTKYFATRKIEELLPRLVKIPQMYFKKLEVDDVLPLWQDCQECYFNYDSEGEHGRKIQFNRGISGMEDDQINVRGNITRALGINILQNISQVPLWRPIAGNSDYNTQAQVAAAKNVLDHYYRVLEANKRFLENAEASFLYGKGYIVQYWDEIEKKLVMHASNPLRVMTSLQAGRKPEWFLFAERVNKWDAIEKYSVPKSEIGNITNKGILDFELDCGVYNVFDLSMGEDEYRYNNDYIDVFHFWHDRTPALKNGRYVIFVNDKVKFWDIELPYDLPIHSLEPYKIPNSPYGYSPLFDMLAYQKMHDALLSNMVERVFRGQQWLATKTETGVKAEIDLENKIVKNGQIQNVDTTSLPSELRDVFDLVFNEIKLVSARNDTVMGDSSAKSGAHAALLYQVAAQFTNSLTVDFNRQISDTGSAQLNLVKDWCEDPIVLQLTGKDNQVYMAEFKREQITDIQTVNVKTVSPHLATPAGQLTIAQDILSKDQSPDAIKKYLRVLDGGDIDELLQEDRDLELTIKHEHELLANHRELNILTVMEIDGTPTPMPTQVVEGVPALVNDPHQVHIKDHLEFRASPTVRNNKLLKSFIDIHLQNHFFLAQNGNNNYLIGSGQNRMPPPPIGISGSSPPPVPDRRKPGSPVLPGRGAPETLNPGPSPRALPNEPSMPVSPLSGQKMNLNVAANDANM